jgi:signal peptidase I
VRRGGRLRTLLAVVGGLVGLVLLLVIVFAVLGFRPYRTPSGSMEPTLQRGDRFVVANSSHPKRGDIVVLHPPAGELQSACGVRRHPGAICPRPSGPTNEGLSLVERVVALPGDRVSIRRGRMVLAGRPQRERYVRVNQPACDACNLPRTVAIPSGHVLTLGDNRAASDDGRYWGPVDEAAIVGRVRLRYWPLSNFGSP